jgi:hypothetical protein
VDDERLPGRPPELDAVKWTLYSTCPTPAAVELRRTLRFAAEWAATSENAAWVAASEIESWCEPVPEPLVTPSMTTWMASPAGALMLDVRVTDVPPPETPGVFAPCVVPVVVSRI